MIWWRVFYHLNNGLFFINIPEIEHSINVQNILINHIGRFKPTLSSIAIISTLISFDFMEKNTAKIYHDISIQNNVYYIA